LFAAARWHEAGRSYEKVFATAPESEQEAALYDALAAHAKAGQEGATLTAWQRADALRALGMLGAVYVSKYPRSERVGTVKFNVARAAYDEANYARAAELFAAFVQEHPTSKDAKAAAHLVLDALHSVGDHDALEAAGRKLAANERLDPG